MVSGKSVLTKIRASDILLEKGWPKGWPFFYPDVYFFYSLWQWNDCAARSQLGDDYGVVITTATRRFSARPFDVWLLAMGYFFPSP